jgi:dihydroxyacetone kinase
MLHACVTGPRFTSPSAPDIAQLMEEVTAELGVNTIVALVKNYTGDVMNFELAAELAAASGLECIMIRVCDDCATQEVSQGARGIAGTVLYEKILGAAAWLGQTSEELASLAKQISESIVSYGVAFRAPSYEQGIPVYDIPAGQAELGVGIHGERGVDRRTFSQRREVIEHCVDEVFSKLSPGDDPLIVLVNDLGQADPNDIESALLSVNERAEGLGMSIARTKVGRFVTSADMDGLSITLMRANPDILRLYDAPTLAPSWSE